jgi:hypothetical protein
MFTALFRPAVWHSMDPDGLLRHHASSCLSVSSVASSVASSSLDSSNSLSTASCSSTVPFRNWPGPSASAGSCTSSTRTSGVVYAKPPFGGAEHVLHYLARYTHRVAISNHRLVACKEDRVSFRWKDYAHGGKQKVMTVSTDEFLRRFLIHVLPKGLVRIRHSGLFANRRRAASLLRCRAFLDAIVLPRQPTPGCQPRCPLCSKPMFIIERITSAQLFVRSLTASASKPRGIDSS